MQHYVCTGGCNGESEKPGVCENEFCGKEGHSLISCECADGLHSKVLEDGEMNEMEEVNDDE